MKLLRWKTVFIVNMIAGCIAYSLLMTNQLVNRMDGLWHGSISYAGDHERCIGRWLWPYFDKLRLYLSPDPVTSVLSLSFFVLAIILVMDLFCVERRFWQYIISLLFTINVSVLVALSYRYMSPVFAASCFFSVLAAYMFLNSENKIILFVAAPLSITAMLGLYQANIGCTCLVFLMYLGRLLYKNEKSIRELLKYIIFRVLSIFTGGVLYLLLTRLCLWFYDLKMSSYGGADSYGIAGMMQHAFDSIHDEYFHFFEYFENSSIHSNFFGRKLFVIICLLLLVWHIFAAVMLFRTNRLNAFLFLLIPLLIPMACNAVLLVAFDYSMSIQMTVPVSMCIPAVLCLLSDTPLPQAGSLPARAYRILLCAGLVLFLYGNYGMILYDQQAMYMSMVSTKELASEIIASLQMNDLYHPYYKYVFLGSPSENPLFARNTYIDDRTNSYAHIGGWTAENLATSMESWRGLLNNEMGLSLYVAEEDRFEEAWNDPLVHSMPVFPEKGSCILMEDVVVVKISDLNGDD